MSHSQLIYLITALVLCRPPDVFIYLFCFVLLLLLSIGCDLIHFMWLCFVNLTKGLYLDWC